MKHLFNDISREEKQRILEMHGVKRNLIKEELTDTSILNFCTKCNEPENQCGTPKMSPDTINKFSAELVSILGGGAPKKGLLGLGGKDYSRVSAIFQQIQNEGNFLDFCSLSKQYGNGNDVLNLCTDLDSKLDGNNKRAVLQSLNVLVNTIQPCKKTPVKKTIRKKTTPIKKPVIQKPPITIPPRKGTGDTYLAGTNSSM